MAADFYTMSTQSSHKAAAWKFIQFLVQPQTELQFYKSFGDTPASIQALNSPTFSGDSYFSTFNQSIQYAAPPPFGAQWPAASNFWMTAIQEIFAGDTSSRP